VCLLGTSHFSGPGRALGRVCVCVRKMAFDGYNHRPELTITDGRTSREENIVGYVCTLRGEIKAVARSKSRFDSEPMNK